MCRCLCRGLDRSEKVFVCVLYRVAWRRWDEPVIVIVIDSPSPVVVVADEVVHTAAVDTAVVVVVVVAEREKGLADRPKRRCFEGGWTRVLALYGQGTEGGRWWMGERVSRNHQ